MTTPIRRSFSATVLAALLALSAGCAQRTPPSGSVVATAGRPMTPQDLASLPSRAPDRRLAYGEDSSQYGELRIPTGSGPHPVVILVHGGCFKAVYATTRDLAPMGDALRDGGIATWNVEYRRLGEPGSGWPGTYLDIGRAVDHVRALAREYPLDLGRVVILGHSAGGHLAALLGTTAGDPALEGEGGWSEQSSSVQAV